MDGKEKAELAAIGAKFREERRSKAKATPRVDQTVKQLAATWKNPGCKPATRVDAYQIWHAKENEGELLAPEQVMVVLESYDCAPIPA